MSAPSAVQALLLVLDGTLIEDDYGEESLAAACSAIAEHSGIPAGHLVAANNAIWPALWDEISNPWMRGDVPGVEVAAEAWRRTFSASAHDASGTAAADRALVARAVDIHRAAERELFRPYADTLPLLDWADAEGLRLALVTNGSGDTQRPKLAGSGLDARFACVAISAEVRSVKPETGIFEYALAQLGAGAASAVMVGDNPDNDIAGTNAAGITSVWLNRTGASTSVVADYEIASLDELPALLQQLAR